MVYVAKKLGLEPSPQQMDWAAEIESTKQGKLDIMHGAMGWLEARTRAVREWTYADQNIVLKKGEEMGRFLLGSTVVLLFPKDALQFNPAWTVERPVRLGEMMGDKPRVG